MTTEQIMAEARRISKEAEKTNQAQGGPLEMYLFQKDGHYLSPQFNWSAQQYFWHWRADKHVIEVLQRRGEYTEVEILARYVHPDGLVTETGADSCNWINDADYDFSN